MKTSQLLEMQVETASSDYKFFNSWNIETKTYWTETMSRGLSGEDSQSSKMGKAQEMINQTPIMMPSFAQLAKQYVLSQISSNMVENISSHIARQIVPNLPAQVFTNATGQTTFAVGQIVPNLPAQVFTNATGQTTFAVGQMGMIVRKSPYGLVRDSSELDEIARPAVILKKRLSQQLIHEDDLDESFFTKVEKFKITNHEEFRKFLIQTSVLSLPKFNVRLKTVSENINKFLIHQDIEYSGHFEIYTDHEISDMQNLSITIKLKNTTPQRCVELLDNLINDIVKMDEKILDYIQIQIIPIL